MYEKWISWLKEVSTELTQDAKIKELEGRKQDLRCEICNLQYEVHRFYGLYSQATLALSKARYNHEITEYKLACIDGRLNIYEVETTKDKNIKDMLSQMSHVDRARLLAELEGMED
jgi:hypothetical protein